MKHTKQIIATLLLTLTLLPLCACGNENYTDTGEQNMTSDENVNDNVTKLEEKEKKSVSEVEHKLQDNTEKSNSQSHRVYFENAVFMGDSLTEPLDYYDVLDSSSVLAVKGQNVIAARKSIDKLKDRNPHQIFIMYGSNDMEYFKKATEFQKNYELLITDIRQKVPTAKISIISPTPATKKAAESNPMLSQERYEEFVSVTKQLCNKDNINYLDITPVLKEKEYYEPDGIHLISSFYNAMLKYLRTIL